MKKMTAKEFKETLDKAGFDFNIYGYEGILNIVTCLSYDEANRQEVKNNNLLADYKRKQANVLHDILEARGYYND